MMPLQPPHRYCIACGTALASRRVEGRSRQVCPACGWVDYLNPKASAAAVVEEAGRLLLVQRARDPWKGCWYLPAGYMEVDETPEQTAERETLEETGLIVRARELLQVFFFDDDPRGNGLVIVYAADRLGGELRGSPESQALGYFGPQELPEKIAGAGHDRAIRLWQAGKRGCRG